MIEGRKDGRKEGKEDNRCDLVSEQVSGLN